MAAVLLRAFGGKHDESAAMKGSEGMLHRLRAFADQHEIRRAWFTTFVLDVSFFERHVLPILLWKDQENRMSSEDSESMNEEMAGGEGGLDLRVFHDYRGVFQSGRPKQTTFTTLPIVPGEVDPRNCEHGVFHPKLAWFETRRGDWYVMAASANLTYGGYARNEEAAVIERVTTREQAEAVRRFFTMLGALDFPAPAFKPAATASPWKLQHTGGAQSFDEAMGWDQQETPWLVAWSPYFSEGLATKIAQRMRLVDQILLVPDLSNEGKMRLEETALDALKGLPNVSFHQAEGNAEAFTHAKVWLTPNRLAVGSWNFTEPALGWEPSNRNNVEAGIIYELDDAVAHQMRNAAQLKTTEPRGAKSTEDAQDTERVGLPDFRYVAQVQLDWMKRELRLQSKSWIREPEAHGPLHFELPGGRQVTEAGLEGGIPIGDLARTLAANRQFHVFDGSERLYTGYLLETGLELRPSRRFDSLKHLFQAWLTRRPQEKAELQRPITAPRDVDPVTGELQKHMADQSHHEWFSTFLAIEYIRQQVRELQPADHVACVRLGFQQPGSIEELRDLVQEEAGEGMYAWFVHQATQAVIASFNEKVDAKDQISLLPPIPSPTRPADVGLEEWHRWLFTLQAHITE